MKKFVFNAYSEPIHLVDVAEPVVGDREVLLEVKAAGVNQLDVKIQAGAFKQILPAKLPQGLGHDVAGVVLQVGSGVRDFVVGDAVYGRIADGQLGTFAERIVVAEHDLAPQPRNLTAIEAGSLPLVALTAWQALVEQGGVTPGQKVLIQAGAGGVGTIAIQLAKHLGAYVATTASAKNADFMRELGADLVIDYRTQDFEQELEGYDLVLDSLGGEQLDKALRVLKPGGLAIGIVGPPDPAFAKAAGMNLVVRLAIGAMSRKVRKLARSLGVEYRFLFMQPSGAQLRSLTKLIEAGAISPVVGATYSFEQTPQALEALERGGHRGKVVVTMS